MGDVIVLEKRKRWRELKQFVESGRLLSPKFDPPLPDPPKSDAAMALAYAFVALGSKLT